MNIFLSDNMRVKFKLINICIRHKSSRSDKNVADILGKSLSTEKKTVTKSRVKKIVLKPNLTLKNASSVKVTSQHVCTKDKPVDVNNFSNDSIFSIPEKSKNSFLVPEPKYLTDNSLDNDTIYNLIPTTSLIKNEKSDDLNYYMSLEKSNNTINHSESSNKNSNPPKSSNINTEAPLANKNDRANADPNSQTRFNALNMQMLSKNLHEKIFGNCTNESPPATPEKIAALCRELQDFNMKLDEAEPIADVDINLPPLAGNNLEEHFFNIATQQTKPYLKIITELLASTPTRPDQWIMQEGWTRYSNGTAERVDYPLEDGMIFDVEVCMSEGPLPTLATAVTSGAWYGWVSKTLVDGTSIPSKSRSLTPDTLIALESTATEFGKKLNDHQKKPKIVVGHNVSYDRARIKEQYWLNSTATRFVDTMSLHVSVSGMNSYQRALMLSKKDPPTDDWSTSTSLNNLAAVYNLYCNKHHEKSARDTFVQGTLLDVRDDFQNLMNYCATDVTVTHEILQVLFPMFQQRFPHPMTFAGMLELGTAYLPVNSNWNRYIEESESTFEDLNYEAKCRLAQRANEVCKLMHNEKYKEDLWMWDEDWSTQPIKIKKPTKKLAKMMEETPDEPKEPSDFEKYLTDGEDDPDPLENEFSWLHKTRHLLYARMPHMPGYPAWYRALCMKKKSENWRPGPQGISTSMKITPKLLNLTWENYPLHYRREQGWGFLVPHSTETDVETQLPLRQLLGQCPLPNINLTNSSADYSMHVLDTEVQEDLHKTEFWRNKKPKKKSTEPNNTFYKGSGVWCNVDIDNCCWFFKLPHKDGSSLNVGNPLAKDFLNKFSENILAGRDSCATEVLKIARTVSYWRNNRDRIMSLLVIWLTEEDLPSAIRRRDRRKIYGAIVPQVVVSGTLTRRATEATWMTASNAKADRVGSELRAMVQAPPGYNIIGADVDSQELWISSLIGDAYCAGIHGATPFGWMTLIGTKANGTDMHSVTAKAVGISRDHAKIINYARIYGAGLKFAERLLKQFNPSMSESDALSKAKKMFAITKGKKVYRIKSEYLNDEVDDRNYSNYEAVRVSKAHGMPLGQMFDGGKWRGGSESAMFNRLEEIAGSQQPITPFLSSRLSRALENDENNEKYLPTKINWVVQSGAVDFLHLMLVSMRWLMRDNVRFCLSFHDEIRYLVPSRYKYNAALAMHVTNLLTRSFCASRLGIKDLPMSVAFFASVEVDTVLRKEATVDCKTPSNPHGLENGYEIPPGESLNIWEALKKSGGSLGPWYTSGVKKKKLEIDEENVADS